MKQMGFGFLKDYKKEFGATLLVGKRKTKRPLSTKQPIHLVLKSSFSLFSPGNRALESIIRTTAQEFHVRLYDLALNWTHIHLVIRIGSPNDYKKFIRALTSKIAAHLRAKKPQLKTIFSLRPFTRILSWGRDFKNTLNYQILNQMEARGLISRKSSTNRKTKSTSKGQAQPRL